MHLFSTDEFLNALADAWFPGKERDIANYRNDGRTFRLLQVGRRSPITSMPFLDFFDAIDAAPDDAAREVRYLPHAVLRTRPLAEAPPPEEPGIEPAPFISWGRFGSWERFERHFCSRRSSLLRDSRAKRRHIEHDLGPIRYVWHDDRPEVFTKCLEWKSAQYLRSGFADLFYRVENVRLFRLLLSRGTLVVSSLSAGDLLLAAHFAALTGGRCYSWIASYDPLHSRYSPGRLLLEAMLEDSFSRGHGEWDFGIGSMEYKWHYATDYRLVGALGRPPLGFVLSRAARAAAVHTLAVCPPLLAQARRLRRYVRQLPARKARPQPLQVPTMVMERGQQAQVSKTAKVPATTRV